MIPQYLSEKYKSVLSIKLSIEVDKTMALGKKKSKFAKNCKKVDNDKYMCEFKSSKDNKKGKVVVQASEGGKKEVVQSQFSEEVTEEEEQNLQSKTMSDVGIQDQDSSTNDNPYGEIRE